ncbi:hypothetical protein C5C66_02450 [Rathayibacter toxicus]|uniref:Solute-binding protein family 3/N-terminal domain-containing protein n=1 Tax=Rathayibacter toxicus TaxID=145458 RepID=A0A2S5Y8Q5_9MICO|nr:hypothetical protein C5D15_02425 [Rathayibacter toxicus]PPG47702.1 hypothetical protein C5D16_02420 [Rathayibacter toxicus]PPH24844.1 hypothetical protein C5D17_02405 [Rathayibacter toxicus]PPH58769.1 hypothetical protein C5D30_02420 [Rathayibacter toxicus]PPH64576.1 hypothetical protein C5D13_02480 [Rathayibacter toxicus]
MIPASLRHLVVSTPQQQFRRDVPRKDTVTLLLTRTSRRVLLGAVATVAALVLAGCSPASTDGVAPGAGGTKTAVAGSGLTLAAITQAGTLTVGTEGTYQPFSYHAEGGTGALTGYDIDVITAVAGKLGVKPTFEETQWDAMFAGLDGGRFNVIANQVAVTAERRAKYDFSTPYSVSPAVVIVAASDNSITDLAGLAGKTTAQTLSSNWYALAHDNGATVEGVEGWAQAIALLKQGRVDATINDRVTWLDWAKNFPDQAAGLKVAATVSDTTVSAFAFPQGSDDLVAAVNSALDQLRADGTLAQISTRYFGTNISQ